ncbi:TrkA family potassium uptake protein [Paenisporosarcina sp. OV554]|uniref:potassium channel family protein n=1 Tax=Paenisporosarcina sp. OV554 TaxID=2135694 RepID=UPI000D3D312C|nr:potassium channel family protein [Paenisporosarcina sp. OV554]PUB16716.1 voltage-gated potassium channel [Paenisporosarcina sp. OV554]
MHFFLKVGLSLVRMKNLSLLIATLIFITFCTVTIYLLEPETFESLLTSFYFVMTTFSTVGYGDYSPATGAGRLFTVLMYLLGIGLLGVIIGKIVDSFSIFRKRKEEGKLAFTHENHIIIVGWGKKTETAVEEILSSDSFSEIVIIDTLPTSPIDVAIDRVHYVQGDASEEETFTRANIKKSKSVIIFADDTIQVPSLRDAKTLTIAITVERLAPHVHTTVELMTKKQIANFSHVKVDEFILSQETTSLLAVRSAMHQNVSTIVTQLISRSIGEDLFEVKKDSNWQTYGDAFHDLLEKGATLIADRQQMDINRRLNEAIPPDAVLYVICNEETHRKLSFN